MKFLKVIERLLGKKSQRPGMTVSISGDRLLDNIGGLAEMSRFATRKPAEFEPPGPPLDFLTSDDIDPATGKAYPDYLERRAKLVAAEEAARNEGVYIRGINHDVHPD